MLEGLILPLIGVDSQLGVLLGADVVVPEAELQVRPLQFVILDDHNFLLVHDRCSWSFGHLGEAKVGKFRGKLGITGGDGWSREEKNRNEKGM